jgi:hypothetical protein
MKGTSQGCRLRCAKSASAPSFGELRETLPRCGINAERPTRRYDSRVHAWRVPRFADANSIGSTGSRGASRNRPQRLTRLPTGIGGERGRGHIAHCRSPAENAANQFVSIHQRHPQVRDEGRPGVVGDLFESRGSGTAVVTRAPADSRISSTGAARPARHRRRTRGCRSNRKTVEAFGRGCRAMHAFVFARLGMDDHERQPDAKRRAGAGPELEAETEPPWSSVRVRTIARPRRRRHARGRSPSSACRKRSEDMRQEIRRDPHAVSLTTISRWN